MTMRGKHPDKKKFVTITTEMAHYGRPTCRGLYTGLSHA